MQVALAHAKWGNHSLFQQHQLNFKGKTTLKKSGRRPQKIKRKTNQSTKINLIGCDTIVNSPSNASNWSHCSSLVLCRTCIRRLCAYRVNLLVLRVMLYNCLRLRLILLCVIFSCGATRQPPLSVCLFVCLSAPNCTSTEARLLEGSCTVEWNKVLPTLSKWRQCQSKLCHPNSTTPVPEQA